MPSTAGTVMTRAAAHLNDANQLVYTSGVLLPFLNMALDELEEELAVFELSPLIEDSITIDVDIDDEVLPQMPVDFVEAITLLERPRDSTDRWVEVKEAKDIDENLGVNKVDTIIQWTARNVSIEINPPQTDREVLLKYIRGLVAASSAGTAVDIELSRRLLALLTARNAARDLGNSPGKADTYEKDISRARDRLTRRLQKNNQSVMGVRRLPYTGRG